MFVNLDEDFASAIKRTKNAIEEKLNQKLLLEKELEKIILAKQMVADKKKQFHKKYPEKTSKLLASLENTA